MAPKLPVSNAPVRPLQSVPRPVLRPIPVVSSERRSRRCSSAGAGSEPIAPSGTSRPGSVVTSYYRNVWSNSHIVAAKPGRHDAHALPVASEADGKRYCLASGYDRRYWYDENGKMQANGLSASLRSPDTLLRDIPAYHHRDPRCIISIKK